MATHCLRRSEASVSEERRTTAEDEIKHLKQELSVRTLIHAEATFFTVCTPAKQRLRLWK